MKKTLTFILIVLSLFLFSSCKKELILENETISHETKFGGIYIHVTIDDFNDFGFSFGDSLDVSFSNGYELLDLPYYNGYYTNTGEALMVGYPGYSYIKVCINNGDDLFTIAGVKETDRATIKLNQEAKYLDIQEALDIHYTDIQGDMSDEEFGNFRVVNVGNLKKDILYRSASPVDNQHNRALVVDRLINGKVNTIINLSDDDAEILEHINGEDYNSPYAKTLYERGSIIAVAMNMNYQGDAFQQKLITLLRFALDNDGPYLIHCVEGKDRTGFVCMVFEALAGASYDEMVNDYMITYNNYYGITKENSLTKYNIIKGKNIDEMLEEVINDDSADIKTADYAFYIEQYLVRLGLKEEEVRTLKSKLTN